MSTFHCKCCVLSLCLALPAVPAAYSAQESKAPATKPALKVTSEKSNSQPGKARESARRTQSINNMKMISLALLNYNGAKKEYPLQAVLDAQRKPLLSWRVQILPYLEAEESRSLYKEFHLDEPWDSEHNKKLLDKMPAVYQNPALPPGNTTNYLVPVGQGTIFGGEKATRDRDIRDGHSKTILVLEVDADRAVPWTKPQDYDVDLQKPLDSLGKLRPNGVFTAAFADGRIHSMTRDIDNATFLLLVNKADGRSVQIPD